jgi:thiol-disulfide isomerase/thioredoxin
VGIESSPGWRRALRFVALAGVAAFVIYALGNRFDPVSMPLKPTKERRAMPDFTLAQLGGGRWSVAQSRGKVVLLNFWATWCPPCRMETPHLVNLHERYREQGFEVIGISLDERQSVVPPFVKRYRIPYPVLLPDQDFALAAQIESLPTSVLLDRQGRVATVYHGAVSESDVRPDVEHLIQEN